jgi:hypothetical protein
MLRNGKFVQRADRRDSKKMNKTDSEWFTAYRKLNGRGRLLTALTTQPKQSVKG